ncbi:unnamed protein product [Rhizophagus irregularis]|nr:unnamed protein product [Rhizophagus irregularis]
MSYDVDLLNGFTMIVMDYIDEDPLAKQKSPVCHITLANHHEEFTPKGAILVDFEWCERHDIDRYPVTMSTEMSWPQGANPGALLIIYEGIANNVINKFRLLVMLHLMLWSRSYEVKL